MTKENQKIEEVNVLTPNMTEEEYAHCISVDECIERLRQRVNKHYHTEEWTKEEEREAFLYTSKVNASRLIARKEYAEGKTISCRTPQEMQQFFDSL